MFYLNDLAARQLFQQFSERPIERGENQQRPHADLFGLGRGEQLQFGHRTHISIGVVEDYSAHTYCYRVRPSDGMGGPLLALGLSSTAFGAFGAKDIGMYTPGTTVAVLKLAPSYGMILGALPFPSYDPRRCLSDQLSYATRTRVDATHRKPLLVGKQRNAINWIANRPFDLVPGSHGWITATGMRLFLTDFMAQLGSGAACGVTAFYKSMLLRVAGYNMKLWTACREHFSGNDQEELLDWTGIAVYPWEQMGLFAKGDPRRELSPEQFQKSEPWYAVWEPKTDKQRPFHRIQEFEGYLGQGGYRVVAAPPVNKPATMEYEVKHQLPGLSADFSTLAGDRVIEAAHSISLIKRILIPVPDRQIKPEDGRGDNPENYKHSGTLGSGTTHKIGVMDASPHKMVAGVLDLHSYLCNWSALHPFAYHAKDWYVPEEGDIGLGSAQYQFPYTSLAGQQYLKPPSPQSVNIDERYGSVNLYSTISYFTQLPDGSITIGNGYGAEIRLIGGDIVLAAPGDVWLKAGRDVIRWAGWDDICRAQNSIDMSATKHDVRIKAGKNMQLLADEGGMLLESKATTVNYDYSRTGEKVVSSGIMFRAATSEITTHSGGLYLRTGSEEGDINAGPIVLDAHRGKQSVVVHARNFDSYLQEACSHYFGEAGNVRAANRFAEVMSTFGGRVYADQGLSSGGAVLVNGSIAVANGGIVTESGAPFVGELSGNALAQVTNSLGQLEQLTKTTYPRNGADAFTTVLQEAYYASNKAGDESLLKQAGFSFRSAEEYLTSSFKGYEDRWQQLARLGGATLPKWEETPVKTEIDPKTYPYPGRGAYEKDCYYEQALALFDAASGMSKPRGGGYTPDFGEEKAASLQNYGVVAQAT